jgi:hypothetical protein
MSKVTERQKFIRHWMDETGETEVDMHAVARFALQKGWSVPPPITDEDRLAKLFKDAARQDVRHDKNTGHPYRGYHAVPRTNSDGQLSFFYIDIDDPKTKPQSFRKACVMRREQMVDDGVQLHLDQNHWNDTRPPEQQIEMLPADLEFDIQMRMATMDRKDDAA